jgi:formylglycine-generating enzyme required for sulfatase activity
LVQGGFTGFWGASDLRLDGQGNLYVAHGFMVSKYSRTLERSDLLVGQIKEGTPPPIVAGLEFESAGSSLFVSCPFKKELLKYPVQAGAILNTPVTVGGLPCPQYIAVDKSGAAFVTQPDANAIVHIQRNGSVQTLDCGGRIIAPNTLAWGGRGFDPDSLYVTAKGGVFEVRVGPELGAELDQRPAEACARDYVETHAGMSLEMSWLPPGSCQMGSQSSAAEVAQRYGGKAESYEHEHPLHAVQQDGFWMGKYELTQYQYEAIMGKNPSLRKDPRRPVEVVTWQDAMEFCERLSRATGRRYVLPTEAQWEYACRAGGTTEWCFGNDPSLLDEYAWHTDNSGHRTRPVGLKRPNAWGLHDMHGNVGEWCLDWYGAYEAATAKNPAGPSSGTRHIARGGAFYDNAAGVRSAKRGSLAVDPKAGWTWCGGVGFRVCRIPSGEVVRPMESREASQDALTRMGDNGTSSVQEQKAK